MHARAVDPPWALTAQRCLMGLSREPLGLGPEHEPVAGLILEARLGIAPLGEPVGVVPSVVSAGLSLPTPTPSPN